LESSIDNAMCRQAQSVPDLIREQYRDLEPKTRTLLSTPEIFSVQRIVLTGCGDSYAAALSMKHVFELLTRIPTEVVEPLELARYYHPAQVGFAPNNPLVFAISNSGGVARVAEAAQFVTAHGGFVVGVTSNPDSALGKSASRVLRLEIPPFEPAPGVRTYAASVLSLLLCAVRIGEVRGMYTMDYANDVRADVLRQADALESMLGEMGEAAQRLALLWENKPAFDFIGCGFDYAAAFYGHAKILEATGRHSACTDAEEWLHLNFFARDIGGTSTVFVANTTNPAISRVREAIACAEKLNRPMLIVTDGEREEFPQSAEIVRVPHTKHPFPMPLTQFVPLALLAGCLSSRIGEEYGRGCKGPWSFAEGGAGVRDSEIHVRKTLLE